MSDFEKLIKDLTVNHPAVRRVSRSKFKHYAPKGMEYCSGRIGWPSKKTPNIDQVTCVSCLNALIRDGVI